MDEELFEVNQWIDRIFDFLLSFGGWQNYFVFRVLKCPFELLKTQNFEVLTAFLLVDWRFGPKTCKQLKNFPQNPNIRANPPMPL